jgi:PPP family 3-phenylpropionic acid transporter
MIKHVPYWRLSGFYWFYFASLGALIPYWGLYLSEQGFNAVEIGELMAVIMATKIVAPYLWGWIADYHGNRLSIIRAGSFLSAGCFAGIFFSSQYGWLFIILLFFSFFWNAVLPQFEALTFNHLGKQAHRYSWIRAWGSIGFVMSVTSMGFLYAYIDITNLPIIVFVLLSGIWIATLPIAEHKGEHQPTKHTPITHILYDKKVIALLLACLFVQASHGPYYTFYSIYAEAHGYSRSYIGLLWAIGVISEVVAFALMPYLVKRFGLRTLLLFSLFSGSVRWLFIAFFIDNLYLTIFAQIFHASTFGIYHAVAITYIHRYFKGKNQGKGQALYSSVSFGAGGMIGSLYGGYLWDSAGSTMTFIIAAILSFIAFAISWKYTENI